MGPGFLSVLFVRPAEQNRLAEVRIEGIRPLSATRSATRSDDRLLASASKEGRNTAQGDRRETEPLLPSGRPSAVDRSNLGPEKLDDSEADRF